MSDRLMSGAVAGSSAVTLAYPLDLVRTRLAAQGEHRYYKGIAHALRTIVRDEGVGGLYRGLGATVLGTGPNIALNYTLYETFKTLACRVHKSEHGPDSRPSVFVSLACGSLSGVVSTTITYPLDLVRRRIQMGPSSAAAYWPSVQAIWRAEGLRGFYHGIRPEYLKVVPGVAIAFGTYELLKHMMNVETVVDRGTAGGSRGASSIASPSPGAVSSSRLRARESESDAK